MRLRAACAVALLALAGCNDDKRLRPVHPTCPGSTQAELDQCAADDFAAKERTMAGVLAEVRDAAAERRTALDEAQEKWASARDTFCEAHMESGGSIQALNVYDCKADLTLDRARDLCTWIDPYGEEPGPRCRALAESVDPIGD